MSSETVNNEANRKSQLLGALLDSGVGRSVIELHPERVTKSSNISYRLTEGYRFRSFLSSSAGVDDPGQKTVFILSGDNLVQLWQSADPILRAEERRIILGAMDRRVQRPSRFEVMDESHYQGLYLKDVADNQTLSNHRDLEAAAKLPEVLTPDYIAGLLIWRENKPKRPKDRFSVSFPNLELARSINLLAKGVGKAPINRERAVTSYQLRITQEELEDVVWELRDSVRFAVSAGYPVSPDFVEMLERVENQSSVMEQRANNRKPRELTLPELQRELELTNIRAVSAEDRLSQQSLQLSGARVRLAQQEEQLAALRGLLVRNFQGGKVSTEIQVQISRFLEKGVSEIDISSLRRIPRMEFTPMQEAELRGSTVEHLYGLNMTDNAQSVSRVRVSEALEYIAKIALLFKYRQSDSILKERLTNSDFNEARDYLLRWFMPAVMQRIPNATNMSLLQLKNLLEDQPAVKERLV